MMLGLTNDGCTGLDSVPLHGKGGVYYTSGYDAGTVANQRDCSAFLPNISLILFVRDPENGVIKHHPGHCRRRGAEPCGRRLVRTRSRGSR